jgi:pimeloyl-ACP methyl ester carboxylesterase
VRTIRGLVVLLLLLAVGAAAARGQRDPLVAAVYPVPNAKGLMVTSGGWAYCEQMRPVARRAGYTLLCARYAKDGYTGPGLRSRRTLDWSDPGYLAWLADAARSLHRRVGGRLVLIGVSYSGFGVATLASHHPELRPDRLIVIDSYLDLLARRRHLPDRHETAREIDRETGGSAAELRRRSVTAGGLARLVRSGTRLSFVWTVSEEERRFFNGATCARNASAETLVQLAGVLRRPVPVWVTTTRHGVNLWRNGVRIVQGKPPGRRFLLRPGGPIPSAAVCE